MPIYEYVCEKCSSHIEVMQKVSEPPLKRCQKCRGKLEKVVSRTSFQLKGSGWYVTDYSAKTSNSSKDKVEKGVDTKPASATAESTGTVKAAD
jgi:putative FmdB family regulatory protein